MTRGLDPYQREQKEGGIYKLEKTRLRRRMLQFCYLGYEKEAQKENGRQTTVL